ncbi:MAG: sigma-70 family RNA polymerase sigma factor [Clostridia bacterium]|nr:sigma-70 family RNA polymerase sigma factor [Clostridia bacterium]
MDEQRERFFIETVRARRQALWRVAYGLLHSAADAEDAVSCAVEATWKHLGRLRSLDALPAYLMRSTIHAAHDELRRRKNTVPVELLENVLSAPREAQGIADYVWGMEEKYRLLLMLKFDEGLQEKEIAQILRIPRGTVSSRISRGLEMLRRDMKKEVSGHA